MQDCIHTFFINRLSVSGLMSPVVFPIARIENRDARRFLIRSSIASVHLSLFSSMIPTCFAVPVLVIYSSPNLIFVALLCLLGLNSIALLLTTVSIAPIKHLQTT